MKNDKSYNQLKQKIETNKKQKQKNMKKTRATIN